MYKNILELMHSLVKLDHSASYELQKDNGLLQTLMLLFHSDFSYLENYGELSNYQMQ